MDRVNLLQPKKEKNDENETRRNSVSFVNISKTLSAKRTPNEPNDINESVGLPLPVSGNE